jgi:ArsR family transcriptional regulator
MKRISRPDEMARLFAALADPTRLRLLNLMNGREVCVCYFVEILAQSQPKISRHLAYLRNAGVVSARRDGKWMHYSILRPADEQAAAILEVTLTSLKSDRAMQSDLVNLDRACCNPQRFVALQGAPIPAGTKKKNRQKGSPAFFSSSHQA